MTPFSANESARISIITWVIILMTDNAYFETPTRMRRIFSYALSVTISAWRRTGTGIKQHIAMDQFYVQCHFNRIPLHPVRVKKLMNDLTFLRLLVVGIQVIAFTYFRAWSITWSCGYNEKIVSLLPLTQLSMLRTFAPKNFPHTDFFKTLTDGRKW